MPGVNVPVAAPNCTLPWTTLASWASVRPCGRGNWLSVGFSAAAGKAAAGLGAAALEPVVGLLAVAEVDAVVPEVVLDDDPHAPSASAAAITAANERYLPHDMRPMMPLGVLVVGLDRASGRCEDPVTAHAIVMKPPAA